MNKSVIIWIIAFLILLNISLAENVETVYETAAVSRIAGNTPEDMKEALTINNMDLNSGLMASDEFALGGYHNEKRNLLNGFLNNNLLEPRFPTESKNLLEKNTFMIIEGSKGATSAGNAVELDNKKAWKDTISKINPFIIYSMPSANNLPMPEGNSLVNNYAGDAVILTNSYSTDYEFTQALICNMGHYSGKTIGELYTQARNKYYQMAPSRNVGLNLMSYNLFGLGSVEYNVPEKYPGSYETIYFSDHRHPAFHQCFGTVTYSSACDPYQLFTHSVAKNDCLLYIDPNEFPSKDRYATGGGPITYDPYIIQSFVENSDYSVQEDSGEQIVLLTAIIPNYNITPAENNSNYSTISLPGIKQTYEQDQLVLPIKPVSSEFPIRTVVTNISLVSLNNPVYISLDNLPSWDTTFGFLKRSCFLESENAGITYSHTFTEDSEIITAYINPIEVINCTSGEFRLYRNITYMIKYVPYSPVIINSVDYPKTAIRNQLVNLGIVLQNTEPQPTSGTLVLSQNGTVIAENEITTNSSNYILSFATPSIEGLYTYDLVFIKDNETLTSNSLDIDVRDIETNLAIPVVVESETNASLILYNRLNTSVNATINYYLQKNKNILQSGNLIETLSPGVNIYSIYFDNLTRRDRYYDIIIDLFYLDTSNTLTGTIVTNHRPSIIPIDYLSVYEGSLVVINVSANDLEGDSLTYSISDSRFSKNGSVFTWQTAEGDVGNYSFTAIVSDSDLESEANFDVQVLPIPPYNLTGNISNITCKDYCDANTFYYNGTFLNGTCIYQSEPNADICLSGPQTIDTFDDGNKIEIINLTQGMNQVVYITIPRNIILYNATYNIEGK